jgi:hypothetical protein
MKKKSYSNKKFNILKCNLREEKCNLENCFASKKGILILQSESYIIYVILKNF